MKPLFTLHKRFINQTECEHLILETFHFKGTFYNDENLAAHRAYLADQREHRTSHAYAVSHGYVEGFTGPLPTINLEGESRFPTLVGEGIHVMAGYLNLDIHSRALFNVQEYYGGSEAVPKHNDGELLEFTTNDGGLQIKRSIRPEQVAVLTLVNDTDGGGTRVHMPDGTSEVVRGEAGDLLVFNNAQCLHSVDPLKGTVKRADGLLRMTIGWRSLADKCNYSASDAVNPISMEDANKLTEAWYGQEWPAIWENIQASTRKAAF